MNKVAVVTGGARGIGKAICDEFKAQNITVCTIDVLPNDYFVGDIADEKILTQFAQKVIDEHTKIDYLVNNACLMKGGLATASYEDFLYVLKVGAVAPFMLTKLFMNHLQDNASIVNISSSRHLMSQADTESYTAAKGKRIHELLALKLLLKNTSHLLMDIEQVLTTKYHQEFTEQIKVSLIRNLTNLFTISNEQAKFSNCIFIKESDNDYIISDIFKSVLQDEKFYFQINEILDFALKRYQKYYQNKYKDTNLVLYQKYTYEEVCYLLNWPQKINPNAMAGYFYEKTTHTLPVFINYIAPDKKRVDYTNEFLSNTLITAYSKSNRKLDSSDAKHIYNANEEQNKLYLFVRKPSEDKEAKEFYFLGEITAQGKPEFAPKYNGFKILYKLDTPVRADIFDYLTTVTV